MLKKAISIRQPWLWAITDLDKRIENREWRPPDGAIGERIALHASKTVDAGGYLDIINLSGQWPPTVAQLHCGAILATAKVVGWIHANGDGNIPSPCLGHLVDDKWFAGPIGWILEDVRKVDPIHCKGALGLWKIPPEVLEVLNLEVNIG